MPPELSSLVTVTSVPLAELQRQLSAGEVLLEYYFDHDKLDIFVLDRETLQAVRGNAAGLVDLVQQLRSNVQDYGSQK